MGLILKLRDKSRRDLIDEAGGDNKIGDVLVFQRWREVLFKLRECFKRCRQLVEMMLQLG